MNSILTPILSQTRPASLTFTLQQSCGGDRRRRRLVHCLCAIKQLIGECKVPIFMSYHPLIVSKVLQMGLSVRLFIQTLVLQHPC